MEWTTRFECWFFTFQSVLLWRYCNDKKPTGYWRYYHSRCRLTGWPWDSPLRPGFHTMSDELILQISSNIFLAFKWILMMRWDQNISHYTTAKPSVHVWNHDLIWWQNKIDTQKTFPQDYDNELYNLSTTKIRITIVQVQMPPNPNQKSGTRGNK